METSGFRHENHNHQQSHVPQQSRRDKLRVQQVLTSTPISQHHFSDHSSLPSTFIDHSHNHHHQHNQEFNLHNARNFFYDNQGLGVSSEALLDHHRPMSISPAGSDVPQSFMLNWPASTGLYNASQPQQPSMASMKPGQISAQRYYLEGMNNNSDQVVTVASTRDVIRSENELALLPFSFGNNLDPATNTSNWMKRHGNNNVDQTTTVVNDRNLQGLSLSLSSINPHVAQVVPPDHGASSDSDRELPKPVPNKPSIIGKGCGKSLQDIVGVSSGSGYNNAHRSSNSNAGPLGPFTGYATILKSSRFLKPAQQLLEEFCGSKLNVMMMNNKGDNNASNSNDVSSERLSVSDVSTSVSAIEVDQSTTGFRDHHHHNRQVAANVNSCASSSTTFYGSSDMNGGDHVSFESRSSRPEHVHHRKAKLLYMQEEVSRRYKQYRQQMQMVVSAFESVAGLSSATPYISLALKAVSRHFRSLKNAIADQLSHTRRALGEDFLSPTAGKGPEALRLKYNMEQQHQKHGPTFHEPPQHHVWRPQRGLPERSVAVLRAWLFEHFLHPYPTDTDKHMLANQTGLTRNQVSNWFINARVRVWKPMVEEIHTLETKGTSAEQGSNKMLDMAGASGHDASDEPSHEKRSRLEGFTHHGPATAAAVVQGFVPYHNHHRGGLEVWTRAEQ